MLNEPGGWDPAIWDACRYDYYPAAYANIRLNKCSDGIVTTQFWGEIMTDQQTNQMTNAQTKKQMERGFRGKLHF